MSLGNRMDESNTFNLYVGLVRSNANIVGLSLYSTNPFVGVSGHRFLRRLFERDVELKSEILYYTFIDAAQALSTKLVPLHVHLNALKTPNLLNAENLVQFSDYTDIALSLSPEHREYMLSLMALNLAWLSELATEISSVLSMKTVNDVIRALDVPAYNETIIGIFQLSTAILLMEKNYSVSAAAAELDQEAAAQRQELDQEEYEYDGYGSSSSAADDDDDDSYTDEEEDRRAIFRSSRRKKMKKRMRRRRKRRPWRISKLSYLERYVEENTPSTFALDGGGDWMSKYPFDPADAAFKLQYARYMKGVTKNGSVTHGYYSEMEDNAVRYLSFNPLSDRYSLAARVRVNPVQYGLYAAIDVRYNHRRMKAIREANLTSHDVNAGSLDLILGTLLDALVYYFTQSRKNSAGWKRSPFLFGGERNEGEGASVTWTPQSHSSSDPCDPTLTHVDAYYDVTMHLPKLPKEFALKQVPARGTREVWLENLSKHSSKPADVTFMGYLTEDARFICEMTAIAKLEEAAAADYSSVFSLVRQVQLFVLSRLVQWTGYVPAFDRHYATFVDLEPYSGVAGVHDDPVTLTVEAVASSTIHAQSVYNQLWRRIVQVYMYKFTYVEPGEFPQLHEWLHWVRKHAVAYANRLRPRLADSYLRNLYLEYVNGPRSMFPRNVVGVSAAPPAREGAHRLALWEDKDDRKQCFLILAETWAKDKQAQNKKLRDAVRLHVDRQTARFTLSDGGRVVLGDPYTWRKDMLPPGSLVPREWVSRLEDAVPLDAMVNRINDAERARFQDWVVNNLHHQFLSYTQSEKGPRYSRRRRRDGEQTDFEFNEIIGHDLLTATPDVSTEIEISHILWETSHRQQAYALAMRHNINQLRIPDISGFNFTISHNSFSLPASLPVDPERNCVYDIILFSAVSNAITTKLCETVRLLPEDGSYATMANNRAVLLGLFDKDYVDNQTLIFRFHYDFDVASNPEKYRHFGQPTGHDLVDPGVGVFPRVDLPDPETWCSVTHEPAHNNNDAVRYEFSLWRLHCMFMSECFPQVGAKFIPKWNWNVTEYMKRIHGTKINDAKRVYRNTPIPYSTVADTVYVRMSAYVRFLKEACKSGDAEKVVRAECVLLDLLYMRFRQQFLVNAVTDTTVAKATAFRLAHLLSFEPGTGQWAALPPSAEQEETAAVGNTSTLPRFARLIADNRSPGVKLNDLLDMERKFKFGEFHLDRDMEKFLEEPYLPEEVVQRLKNIARIEHERLAVPEHKAALEAARAEEEELKLRQQRAAFELPETYMQLKTIFHGAILRKILVGYFGLERSMFDDAVVAKCPEFAGVAFLLEKLDLCAQQLQIMFVEGTYMHWFVEDIIISQVTPIDMSIYARMFPQCDAEYSTDRGITTAIETLCDALASAAVGKLVFNHVSNVRLHVCGVVMYAVEWLALRVFPANVPYSPVMVDTFYCTATSLNDILRLPEPSTRNELRQLYEQLTGSLYRGKILAEGSLSVRDIQSYVHAHLVDYKINAIKERLALAREGSEVVAAADVQCPIPPAAARGDANLMEQYFVRLQDYYNNAPPRPNYDAAVYDDDDQVLEEYEKAKLSERRQLAQKHGLDDDATQKEVRHFSATAPFKLRTRAVVDMSPRESTLVNIMINRLIPERCNVPLSTLKRLMSQSRSERARPDFMPPPKYLYDPRDWLREFEARLRNESADDPMAFWFFDAVLEHVRRESDEEEGFNRKFLEERERNLLLLDDAAASTKAGGAADETDRSTDSDSLWWWQVSEDFQQCHENKCTCENDSRYLLRDLLVDNAVVPRSFAPYFDGNGQLLSDMSDIRDDARNDEFPGGYFITTLYSNLTNAKVYAKSDLSVPHAVMTFTAPSQSAAAAAAEILVGDVGDEDVTGYEALYESLLRAYSAASERHDHDPLLEQLTALVRNTLLTLTKKSAVTSPYQSPPHREATPSSPPEEPELPTRTDASSPPSPPTSSSSSTTTSTTTTTTTPQKSEISRKEVRPTPDKGGRPTQMSPPSPEQHQVDTASLDPLKLAVDGLHELTEENVAKFFALLKQYSGNLDCRVYDNFFQFARIVLPFRINSPPSQQFLHTFLDYILGLYVSLQEAFLQSGGELEEELMELLTAVLPTLQKYTLLIDANPDELFVALPFTVHDMCNKFHQLFMRMQQLGWWRQVHPEKQKSVLGGEDEEDIEEEEEEIEEEADRRSELREGEGGGRETGDHELSETSPPLGPPSCEKRFRTLQDLSFSPGAVQELFTFLKDCHSVSAIPREYHGAVAFDRFYEVAIELLPMQGGLEHRTVLDNFCNYCNSLWNIYMSDQRIDQTLLSSVKESIESLQETSTRCNRETTYDMPLFSDIYRRVYEVCVGLTKLSATSSQHRRGGQPEFRLIQDMHFGIANFDKFFAFVHTCSAKATGQLGPDHSTIFSRFVRTVKTEYHAAVLPVQPVTRDGSFLRNFYEYCSLFAQYNTKQIGANPNVSALEKNISNDLAQLKRLVTKAESSSQTIDDAFFSDLYGVVYDICVTLVDLHNLRKSAASSSSSAAPSSPFFVSSRPAGQQIQQSVEPMTRKVFRKPNAAAAAPPPASVASADRASSSSAAAASAAAFSESNLEKEYRLRVYDRLKLYFSVHLPWSDMHLDGFKKYVNTLLSNLHTRAIDKRRAREYQSGTWKNRVRQLEASHQNLKKQQIDDNVNAFRTVLIQINAEICDLHRITTTAGLELHATINRAKVITPTVTSATARAPAAATDTAAAAATTRSLAATTTLAPAPPAAAAAAARAPATTTPATSATQASGEVDKQTFKKTVWSKGSRVVKRTTRPRAAAPARKSFWFTRGVERYASENAVEDSPVDTMREDDQLITAISPATLLTNPVQTSHASTREQFLEKVYDLESRPLEKDKRLKEENAERDRLDACAAFFLKVMNEALALPDSPEKTFRVREILSDMQAKGYEWCGGGGDDMRSPLEKAIAACKHVNAPYVVPVVDTRESVHTAGIGDIKKPLDNIPDSLRIELEQDRLDREKRKHDDIAAAIEEYWKQMPILVHCLACSDSADPKNVTHAMKVLTELYDQTSRLGIINKVNRLGSLLGDCLMRYGKIPNQAFFQCSRHVLAKGLNLDPSLGPTRMRSYSANGNVVCDCRISSFCNYATLGGTSVVVHGSQTGKSMRYFTSGYFYPLSLADPINLNNDVIVSKQVRRQTQRIVEPPTNLDTGIAI